MNFSPLAFWSTDFEIVYYSIAAASSSAAAATTDDAYDVDCTLGVTFNIQSTTLVRTYQDNFIYLLLMNKVDDEFDYLFLLQLEPQNCYQNRIVCNLFQLVRNHTLVIRIS